MGLFARGDASAADRKALAEQIDLLQKNPRDVRMLAQVAELQQKLGERAEAARHYLLAAGRYAEEGFFLKAVAMSKVAFTLRLPGPEELEALAGFYLQLDLADDAFDALKRAIALYDQRGDKARAGACRRQILAVDPDNAAGRVALAEHLVAQGQLERAIAELDRAHAHLEQIGRAQERDRVRARRDYLKAQHGRA